MADMNSPLHALALCVVEMVTDKVVAFGMRLGLHRIVQYQNGIIAF